MDEHTRDFGVRPFAAGVVTGLRAFRIAALDLPWMRPPNPAALKAVSAEYMWQPGENVAQCIPPFGTMWWFTKSLVEDPHEQLAGVGCSCGFYAYFADSNDYDTPNRFNPDVMVSGIVEGYGVVTIGHRGFRAEKARIVALVKPRIVALVKPRNAAEHTPEVLAELDRFGVTVYDTTADALAAHPTTRPEDVGIDPTPPPADVEDPSQFTATFQPNGQVVVTGLPGGTVVSRLQQLVTQQTIANRLFGTPAPPPPPVSSTPPPAPSAWATFRGATRTAAKSLRQGTQPDPSQTVDPAVFDGLLELGTDVRDDTARRYAIGGSVNPPERNDELTPQQLRDARRDARQDAARARQQAGLRGVGGFDKRGRRR